MGLKIVNKDVKGRTHKYYIHAEENPDMTVNITLEIHSHIFKSYTFGAEYFLLKFVHKKGIPKCVKIAIRDVLKEFTKYRLDMVYLTF